MFFKDVRSTIYISVDEPTLLGLVQSPLDTFAASLKFNWIVSVVNRDWVTIYKTGFGSVGFLLFNKSDTVSLTEAFQLEALAKRGAISAQGKNWNLDKVLIIASTHIRILFHSWVVAHNNFPNSAGDTVVDNIPSRFVQIISDATITTVSNSTLLFGKSLNTLLVFFRLKLGISFVKPLINGFKSLTVNNKTRLFCCYTSCQVIHAQVNSHHLCWVNLSRSLVGLVDVSYIKSSCVVLGINANFFNSLFPQPWWNGTMSEVSGLAQHSDAIDSFESGA